MKYNRKYTLEDLENILDTIPTAIWAKDENDEYIYANNYFCSLLKVEKDDIIGKTSHDFDENKILNRENNNFDEIINNNISIEKQAKRNINGEDRYFEAINMTLDKSNSNSKYTLGICNDITLEKALEKNFKFLRSYKNLILTDKNYNLNLVSFSKINPTYNEFIHKELSDIEFKDNLKEMLNYAQNKLQSTRLDIFLYNSDSNALNFYLSSEKSIDYTGIKESCFINEKDLKDLLSSNIVRKGYYKNNCFFDNCSDLPVFIESYPLKHNNTLIGILNIYYEKDSVPTVLQTDFINSICNKITIIFLNKIFSSEFTLLLEKRNYLEYELDLFLNTATDLYAIISYDGSYLKVNSNWTNTLGWTHDELTTMKFQDLIHPSDFETKSKINEFLENKEYYKYSGLLTKYMCKNGDIKMIEWNYTLVESVNCIILTGQDKSAQIELEKQKLELENAVYLESLKCDFFANISHEFKTPINIILNSIQVMSSYFSQIACANSFNKICTYSSSIKQNSYRLLKLVNNLLDLTKLDEGYSGLNIYKCNIVTLIEEIISSVAQYLGDNKRRIIFDTTDEEIITACDPEKIETIMLNLVSNAMKFTQDNGLIEINLSLDDEKQNVLISVKDDGDTIDPEFVKIIFDRFTQQDDLLNRRCEGSGLGLAIVKSLVDLHHGDIWVNTEFTDGAEIIFTLPMVECDDLEDLSNYNDKFLQSNINKLNIEFSDIYNL